MLYSDLIRYGKSGVVHNWPEYSKSLEKLVREYGLVKDPNNVTWPELEVFCENFLNFYPGTNTEKSVLVSLDAGNLARQKVHQRIKSSYQLVSGYIQIRNPLNNNEISNEKNINLIKSSLLTNFQEIINEYGENPEKEKFENEQKISETREANKITNSDTVSNLPCRKRNTSSNCVTPLRRPKSKKRRKLIIK